MPSHEPSDLALLWQQGADEFNRHRYWHAHEPWEEGWKRLSGPSRERVQALIQVCAVFVHLEKGRPDPALRLARRALEKLAAAPGVAASSDAPHGEAASSEATKETPIEIAGVEPALAKILAALEADPRSVPQGWEALAHALQARVIRQD